MRSSFGTLEISLKGVAVKTHNSSDAQLGSLQVSPLSLYTYIQRERERERERESKSF